MTEHELATLYYRAGHPLILVESVEEDRVIQNILSIEQCKDRPAYRWDGTGSLVNVRTCKAETGSGQTSLPDVIRSFRGKERTLLFLLDAQTNIENAPIYRSLRNAMSDLKQKRTTIWLIAPSWSRLPAELQTYAPCIEWPLPDRDMLKDRLEFVRDSASEETTISPERERECVDAATGLTHEQAENAFALSYIRKPSWDPRVIEAEKVSMIKRSGHLEVWPCAPLSDVGGMAGLKEFMQREVLPWRSDPQLAARAIILLGPPGVGKSLFAKAVGALMGRPVLRCDVAALKGSLVGESERRTRQALKLADATAPVVLFIDELEKGIGGYASSAHTDSGVTLGMVGTMLTWLQEHTSDVFTVATVNDYAKLPTEFTRAGRFDERFFIDLPNLAERVEVAAIHLSKYGCDTGLADLIAAGTTDWTGAEIEQLIKTAARLSDRKMDEANIGIAAALMKPLCSTSREAIEKLREFAETRFRFANETIADITAAATRSMA